MALELYYTSASKGLVAGSTGFCTVAMTTGMTEPMRTALEALSGYRAIYRVGSPDAHKNPPEFAHRRLCIGRHYYSALSHVCFAGTDQSLRSSSKFAHHLILEAAEQAGAGPAWVMMQAGMMEDRWSGRTGHLPVGKTIPPAEASVRKCVEWEKTTGDAGWAGALADKFLLDAKRPSYIIYELGTDPQLLLRLFDEALALLPPEVRWRVTFSTYFRSLPAGVDCCWRCCVAGTEAAEAASSNATSGVLIDLTSKVGRAPDGRYASMARTGEASTAMDPVSREGDRVVRVPAPESPHAHREHTAPAGQGDRQSGTFDLEPLRLPNPTWQSARKKPTPQPRRRTSPVFWIVAIVWPILVLGVGSVFLLNKEEGEPNESTTAGQLVEGSDSNPSPDTPARKKTKAEAPPEKPPGVLVTDAGDGSGIIEISPRTPSRQKRPLAGASVDSETPRTPSEHEAEAEASSQAERSDRARDPDPTPEVVIPPISVEELKAVRIEGFTNQWMVKANLIAVDLSVRPPTERIGLVRAMKGAEVRFRLPLDQDGGWPFEFHHEDQAVVVSSKGMEPDYEIARARVENGVLWWSWRPIPRNEKGKNSGLWPEELRDLHSVLGVLTLSVIGPDGKPQTVQLREPETGQEFRVNLAIAAPTRIRWRPWPDATTTPPEVDKQIRAASQPALELRLRTPLAGDWESLSSEPPRSIVFHKTLDHGEVRFHVKLSAGTKCEIESDWGNQRAVFEQEIKDAERENSVAFDDRKKAHKKKKAIELRLSGDILEQDEEFKRLKGSIHQLNETIKSNKRANRDHNESIKALESFEGLGVRLYIVSSRSGVVVADITLGGTEK